MVLTIKILQEKIQNGEQFTYTPFYGGPFSQWWKCKFKVGNHEYNCAEQYMMASKARLFHDIEILEKILKAQDPKNQKDLGRRIKNYNENLWNEIKINIVKMGNIAKFSQNAKLKEKLIATNHSILVEASPYDKIWGVGLSENHPNIKDPFKWQGENLLGFILTQVRNELKNDKTRSFENVWT